MKKVLAVFLSAITVVCTACGSSGKGSGSGDGVTAKETDMNTVFTSSAVDMGDSFGTQTSIGCLTAADSGYYMVAQDWSKDDDPGTLYTISEDGSNVKESALPDMGEGMSFAGAAADKDGNVYEALNAGHYDDDSDNYVAGKMTLRKISSDGSVQWDIDLYVPKSDDDEGDFSISGLLVNESDGNIYVGEPDANKIESFSLKDGSAQGSCKVPQEGMYGVMACSGDGDVIFCAPDDDGNSLYKVDMKKAATQKIENVDQEAINYGTIYSGDGKNIYSAGDSCIYTIDLSTGKSAMLIDFTASDIDADSAELFAGDGDGHYALAFSDSNGNYQVLTLAKADEDIYKNKTTLTLGCSYADSQIKSQVIAFNRASDKYRINITQYSSTDDSGDDTYGGPINKLLLSGDIPDMLLLDTGVDYTTYAKKGLFEDLDSYFGGSGPQDTDYMTNVFDTCRTDGKLYILPTNFVVDFLLGKQSDFGDVSATTTDQIEAVAKKHGIAVGDSMGSYMTSDIVLQQTVMMTLQNYVDFDSGKCSFDSDQFKKLLKFASQFPQEIKDDEAMVDNSDGLRSGKQAVMPYGMTSFDDYNDIITGYVGEPTAFMGYPSDGTVGPVIQVQKEIAMSSSSENKDGCWEFMQYLIGDDATDGNISYGFPVNMKRLEKMEQESTQKKYYQDENGQRQEEERTVSVGDQEIQEDPLTQEEADVCMKLLKNTTASVPVMMNNSIFTIISEETGAYFSGQKSADDVAKTIQSRVNIYINENK